MYPRLRDLREDRDLSQKELAKMIGMSQTGYSKYETGENDIPTQILIKLADFYGTTTDYILGRTNVIKPYPVSKRLQKQAPPLGKGERREAVADEE